jgi:hypothetical protein
MGGARSVKVADLDVHLSPFRNSEEVMRHGPTITVNCTSVRCVHGLRPLACPSATCSSAPLASRVEPHLGPTVDVRRNSALSELWDEVSCRDCGSQSISGCSNAAWLYYQSATAVSTSWKLLPTWSFSPLARDDDAESGSVKGIVPGTSVVSDVPAHPRARVLSTLPRASTFGKASCDGARWPPRMIHSSTPLLGTIDG